MNLRPDDYMLTTYRGLHDHIAKGIPLVVTDACGAGNPSAAQRSLDALATAGDAILTDISTITDLLARHTTPDPAAIQH